jgi:thiol:disulfide interchange protein DsbD
MRFFLLVISCLLFSTLHSQSLQDAPKDFDLQPTDVIHWEALGAESSPGKVIVNLRLTTEQNFSIYVKHMKFAGPAGWELTKMVPPTPSQIVDPLEGTPVEVYSGGAFILEFTSFGDFSDREFPLAVTYLGCTERICLFPFTETINIQVFPGSANTLPEITEIAAPPPEQPALAAPPPKFSEILDSGTDSSQKLFDGQMPFGLLLLILFVGGLATNLTPCVLPMIPITVRVLSSTGKSGAFASFLYMLGIVISYTILGVGVALTGGLFGSFMANPVLNIAFALIFFVLAIGMLGFVNFARLQSVGMKISDVKTSKIPLNIFMMGAGAGLVAAPCTGPILGALMTFTAHNPELSRASLQFLVYSFGFALPYLFLGMASHKVSRITLSPAVTLWVKWLFAAIMFGLSFYYLRIPFYESLQALNGSWYLIATWCLVAGIATLFAVVALPKLKSHRWFQVVPTLVLGLGIFAGAQWASGKDISHEGLIPWIKDLDAGLAAAQEQNKPILIDGWAEWCEACKKMDASTFVDPDVVSEISANWIAIKLDLTEFNEANQQLAAKYELLGLPTLILLPPSGDMTQATKISGWANAPDVLSKTKAFKQQHHFGE